MAGPYPVTYNIADVARTEIIDDVKFNEIATAVNQERARRGYGPVTFQFVNQIDSEELNALVNAISSVYEEPGSFAGVNDGDIISNTHINLLIDKLQSAGSVCICNCNYCTCDCNYCTCNCNYCPCDCNYCPCDCNYCACNCNYCPCDCNYCTCNCNYACTCNCNYSDERLKTEIVYM